MTQVSQDKFVEFCLEVTSGLAQLGVTKFCFQIQTEHLKYFVNTDPSNVDVDKNMKKKMKNKSPSAKRKNQTFGTLFVKKNSSIQTLQNRIKPLLLTLTLRMTLKMLLHVKLVTAHFPIPGPLLSMKVELIRELFN